MKNYTLNKMVILVIASFLLISCSTQTQNNTVASEIKTTEIKLLMLSKIRLHDLSDNTLAEIVNNGELSLFSASWKAKLMITFIKKPDLPYRLTLFRNGKKETWLFDGHNVVTRYGKSNTGYYSLPDLSIFNKYINLHKTVEVPTEYKAEIVS